MITSADRGAVCGRTAGAFALVAMLSGVFAPLPVALADEAGRTWQIAPLLGVNSPRLKLLNDGEFQAPLPGRGRIIFADTGENINYDFMLRNDLPEIQFGTEAGVEFQLALNERDALLLGFSVWEGVSTSVIQTEVPFQGVISPTGFERSGNVSYFQYFLGWEHEFLRKNAGKQRMHYRIALHEIFDIDYREDLVFAFQGGPAETFKRIVVMESQATGVMMLQLGVGGEVFLRDWFSIGFDAGYSYGFQEAQLGNASIKTNLDINDNLDFKLPARLDPAGNVQYLAAPATFEQLSQPGGEDAAYRPFRLDFDGWRILLRMNFYF